MRTKHWIEQLWGALPTTLYQRQQVGRAATVDPQMAWQERLAWAQKGVLEGSERDAFAVEHLLFRLEVGRGHLTVEAVCYIAACAFARLDERVQRGLFRNFLAEHPEAACALVQCDWRLPGAKIRQAWPSQRRLARQHCRILYGPSVFADTALRWLCTRDPARYALLARKGLEQDVHRVKTARYVLEASPFPAVRRQTLEILDDILK
jgi:hypothetical protein